MKKVAIMLGDGFEPIEVMAPADALRRGGAEVTLVSVMANLDVTAAQDITVKADKVVEDVDFDSFDMIVVPGGSVGVENLKKCDELGFALQTFMSHHKLVGSICAGPTVLAELGLLDGRKATCYPGCETDFPQGVYQEGIGVVRDDNLITASGPGQALEFGIELLRALKGDADGEAVAKAMLFNI